MGKKQRQKQHPQKVAAPVSASPFEAAARQPALTVEQRRTVAAASTSSRTRTSVSWPELSQQYRHVNAELKEIGILAGSFLIVLLVLTAILG